MHSVSQISLARSCARDSSARATAGRSARRFRRPHRSGLVWLTSAIAVVASIAADIVPAEAQRRRPGGDVAPAVTLADVRIEKINERVAAVGSARARQQITLTTRVAGVIEAVLFKGGDKVEAGQPLVRLVSEPEAIAVETAEAQRAQAFDTVQRYRQLNEASVSRVARAEAETALKVADAALRNARESLARLTITAPFGGVMGLTDLETGDYLAVGNPIATLDDRSTLIIEFTVPEAVATSIKIGMPVRANQISRTGKIYQGAVQAVGTRIDPLTRTLIVRAEIPNADLVLIPGSTFSVSIQLPGDEAAALPGLAIQWDRAGAYVWRLKDDNSVERVNVAILSRDGDTVMVESALRQGDKVIREGGGFLREKQEVRPQSS
jgi:RND family efflux transporter MFP subunit